MGGGTAGGSDACACDGGCVAMTGCPTLCTVPSAPRVCDGGVCVVPLPLTTLPVYRVWGDSSGNLWASVNNGNVFRYDGAGWACIPTPPLSAHHDLFATSSDVWVAGDSATGPAIWRFLAGTRTTATYGSAQGFHGAGARAVWGDGTNVWASTDREQIFRFSGGWTLEFDGGFRASSIHGSGPTIWATTAPPSTSVLRRPIGSASWSSQSSTAGGTLVAIAGRADGGAIAIQAGGEVFEYAGGAWSFDDWLFGFTSGGSPLNMRTAQSRDNEVYAGGELMGDGVLYRDDPTLGWQRILRLPQRGIHDLWVAQDRAVWLGTGGGTVHRYTPPDCTPLALPVADEFNEPLGLPYTRITNVSASQWFTDGGVLFGNVQGGSGSFNNLRVTLPRPGFRGASVSIEIVEQAKVSGSDVGTATFLFVAEEADVNNHQLKFDIGSGSIRSYVGRADQSEQTASIPAGGLRFIRIRESNGVIYFEHTNNARGAWTEFDRYDKDGGPDWLDDIDIVTVGIFNGTASPTSFARFDNLNRCPF